MNSGWASSVGSAGQVWRRPATRRFRYASDRPTGDNWQLSDSTVATVVADQSREAQSGAPVSVPIFEVDFLMSRDEDDEIVLSRPGWSLVGAGASFPAAYANLLREAIEVAPMYAALPPHSLDSDARELRKFLTRFL